MLNDLIDGISIAIDGLYSGCDIYCEELKQGFKSPCFFILPLEPMNTNKLGVKALREYPFDVHYFPKTETNREMYEVAENLLLGLEYITLVDGSLVRAKKQRYEIVDGVLHFMFELSFHINKPQAVLDPMQELDYVKKE